MLEHGQKMGRVALGNIITAICFDEGPEVPVISLVLALQVLLPLSILISQALVAE